jgi:hypothetical protein
MKPFSAGFVFALAVSPLTAGVIIGTADTGAGNSFPFGAVFSSNPGSVYQQVYAASDFSGPITISDIEFYRSQFGAPTDTLTSATYTFKLSYVAGGHGVDSLDTTTFSNNVGAGLVTFGTYVLSGATAGNQVTFVSNGSTFNYNPANGALLLEIDLTSIGTRGTAFLDDMFGDSGGVFSRAHDFGTQFNDTGLVTGFDSATTPEPATFALIGVSLLAIPLLRRRK